MSLAHMHSYVTRARGFQLRSIFGSDPFSRARMSGRPTMSVAKRNAPRRGSGRGALRRALRGRGGWSARRASFRSRDGGGGVARSMFWSMPARKRRACRARNIRKKILERAWPGLSPSCRPKTNEWCGPEPIGSVTRTSRHIWSGSGGHPRWSGRGQRRSRPRCS